MTKRIFISVGLLFLFACNDNMSNAGESTTYGSTKPAGTTMTPDVTRKTITGKEEKAFKILGTPRAVFVVTFDVNGNATIFEREGTENAKYPKKGTFERPFIISFQKHVGSHCVDVVDSTGTTRRRCYPPNHPCHAAGTC